MSVAVIIGRSQQRTHQHVPALLLQVNEQLRVHMAAAGSPRAAGASQAGSPGGSPPAAAGADQELAQLKQREAELLGKLEAQNCTLDKLLLLDQVRARRLGLAAAAAAVAPYEYEAGEGGRALGYTQQAPDVAQQQQQQQQGKV
jgi:hypothetical protein